MISNSDHLVERFGPSFIELKAELDGHYAKNPYVLGHSARFAATILQLRQLVQPGWKVLELGWSNVLHRYVDNSVASWDYTVFEPGGGNSEKLGELAIGESGGRIVPSTTYNINFERDAFPAEAGLYDIVICAEVIEHMDVDPMSLMSEVNRVTRTGGKLLITTPNSTSARIVFKVINGYHPSFFMQYSKDASPYRHNFEYTTSLLEKLVTASGYQSDFLETLDTFEDALQEGYAILGKLNASTKNRGDNIFLGATKQGPVLERYPPGIYA